MQVGFCNLIKKEKDHTNQIWVADANENSTYYLKFDSSHCSHLRFPASSVTRLASNSSLVCMMEPYWSKLELHGSISNNDTLFLFFLSSADNTETQGMVVGYNW